MKGNKLDLEHRLKELEKSKLQLRYSVSKIKKFVRNTFVNNHEYYSILFYKII